MASFHSCLTVGAIQLFMSPSTIELRDHVDQAMQQTDNHTAAWAHKLGGVKYFRNINDIAAKNAEKL